VNIARPTALLALTLAAVAAGCGGSGTSSELTSTQTPATNPAPVAEASTSGHAAPAAAATSCPDGGLTFGVEPYEDPAKLKPAYETLATALQSKLGCQIKLQIVSDYSAEVLAMKNDKLDLAEFGPLGFVFASQLAGAEPLVSFADGSGQLTTYKAGIWVPKDSPVKTLADLKGKSLALSEPGSTSGDALPRYALIQAGLDPEKDLKLEYAGGHPESLLALTNGKVDAAEINTQQLATATSEGSFDESKYRRIWESDPIPNDPITIRSTLDDALKTAIQDALESLEPGDVAKIGAFLDVNPPGPLIPVTKETYQPLFDLAHVLHLTEKDV
jgi:phosphonate transport system substrate-binding protein